MGERTPRAPESSRSLTNKALGPGERTILRVDMMPYTTAITSSNKVLILVGWKSADRVLPARFDTLGNWGGPYRGRLNAGLEAELLKPGACVGYGADASQMTYFPNWEAWHTTVGVDNTNPTLADFGARLRAIIRMERPGSASSGGIGEFVIFSGAWNDADNDNVYDAGEGLACTGVAFLTVPYVGD